VDIIAPVGAQIPYLDQLRITNTSTFPVRRLLSLLPNVRTQNLEIRGSYNSFQDAYHILTDCRTLSFHSSGMSPVSDIIRAVSENQNLTTFSMSLGSLIVDIPPQQFADTILELPKLWELELKSTRLLWTMFCRAAIPSLASLNLSQFTTIDDQLSDFLTRYPTTSLTDLTISHCTASHPQLISLLRASPHLHAVTFEGISDINEVVEFLAATYPDVTQGLPCPSLEKLGLTSCATLRSGPIVRLIKERAIDESVVTIGTLLMDYCPLIEPEVRDWLGRNVPSFSCVYTRKKDTRWKR